MVLARKLHNSITQEKLNENTQIKENQVLLIQDLNSALLALQLVTLEAVEQIDPILSKESLLNILVIAETLSSELDTVISLRSELILDCKCNEELNSTQTAQNIPQIEAQKSNDELKYKDDTRHGLLNQSEIAELEKDTVNKVPNFAETSECANLVSKPETLEDSKIYDMSTECTKEDDKLNKDTSIAVLAEVKGTNELPDLECGNETRSYVLESLLMETAKTIIIPVVGDVLNEDIPATPQPINIEMPAENPKCVTSITIAAHEICAVGSLEEALNDNVLEKNEIQEHIEKENKCFKDPGHSWDSPNIIGKSKQLMQNDMILL